MITSDASHKVLFGRPLLVDTAAAFRSCTFRLLSRLRRLAPLELYSFEPLATIERTIVSVFEPTEGMSTMIYSAQALASFVPTPRRPTWLFVLVPYAFDHSCWQDRRLHRHSDMFSRDLRYHGMLPTNVRRQMTPLKPREPSGRTSTPFQTL